MFRGLQASLMCFNVQRHAGKTLAHIGYHNDHAGSVPRHGAEGITAQQALVFEGAVMAVYSSMRSFPGVRLTLSYSLLNLGIKSDCKRPLPFARASSVNSKCIYACCSHEGALCIVRNGAARSI